MRSCDASTPPSFPYRAGATLVAENQSRVTTKPREVRTDQQSDDAGLFLGSEDIGFTSRCGTVRVSSVAWFYTGCWNGVCCGSGCNISSTGSCMSVQPVRVPPWQLQGVLETLLQPEIVRALPAGIAGKISSRNNLKTILTLLFPSNRQS